MSSRLKRALKDWKEQENDFTWQKKVSIDAKTINPFTSLNIYEALVLSADTYGMHVTPNHDGLSQLWASLEKDIVIS